MRNGMLTYWRQLQIVYRIGTFVSHCEAKKPALRKASSTVSSMASWVQNASISSICFMSMFHENCYCARTASDSASHEDMETSRLLVPFLSQSGHNTSPLLVNTSLRQQQVRVDPVDHWWSVHPFFALMTVVHKATPILTGQATPCKRIKQDVGQTTTSSRISRAGTCEAKASPRILPSPLADCACIMGQ